MVLPSKVRGLIFHQGYSTSLNLPDPPAMKMAHQNLTSSPYPAWALSVHQSAWLWLPGYVASLNPLPLLAQQFVKRRAHPHWVPNLNRSSMVQAETKMYREAAQQFVRTTQKGLLFLTEAVLFQSLRLSVLEHPPRVPLLALLQVRSY